MTVLARKRTLSQLEFYVNAINLRREVTKLLLRDLGIKSTVRNIRVNTKKMETEDAENFAELLEKYQLKIAGDYPEYKSWRGDKRRYNAYHTLRNMDKLFKELNETWKKENSLPKKKEKS